MRYPLLPIGAAFCAALYPFSSLADRFTFAELQSIAQDRAVREYEVPPDLPEVLNRLNYDQYRAIKTSENGVLWEDRESPFRIEFLHSGYLFEKPVKINIISGADEIAHPLPFEKKWFNYDDLVVNEPIEEERISGFAGFRIRHPLNGGPDDFDEIGSFVGASYFRLMGRDQSYGISARGLAINSVNHEAEEEFPDFVEYWLVEPDLGDNYLHLYALLDSPSVAGAYQFKIYPGVSTDADIDVSLYFRKENPSVGLAPLTSMFWFGENHKERPFMDWRPEVHDSDGLLFTTWNDETVWRPLYNHHAIRYAWFNAPDVKGYGLLQRDREFENYQDLSNPYWLTPTGWVQPKNKWGEGAVRLIELPTNNEGMDNVVAFYEPKTMPKAGDSLSYSYTLSWKMHDESTLSPKRAISTRLGEIVAFPDTRRFVIDFDGPDLRAMPADAPVFAEINSSSNGFVTENQCFKNVKTDGWRVEFKLDTDDSNVNPVELRCRLLLSTTKQPISETWSYQWSP